MKAVIYARVSSKEQEKEGYSIPAQLKVLREYAATKGLRVMREFVDIETAKQTGRASFGGMIAALRGDPSIRALLVEKTDRLYRNMKDWVTVEDLDLEIHFVKEGEVLTKESRSSAKFMHGIKVLMAKNYIDNLSEEARKGMQEKAEQGIWPTVAPLGYANTTGSDGKKVIAIDLKVAPFIVKLFETYATGTQSLKEATKRIRADGFLYPRSGGPVPVSTVHKILRSRIYMGDFDYKGAVYAGKHEPLVSRELWQAVQDVLDGRHAKRSRRGRHAFAFSGIINCGHCGCALVGDLKKGKYVYYRCSGYKGKCPEPYVREEVLEAQFSGALGRLQFDREILDWVRDALRESHTDEKREHQAAVDRLQAQRQRLQGRIDAMYLDKLDGRITVEFFDGKSAEWRAEQDQCLREIERHQQADQSYLNDGVRILELAQSARRLFDQQPAREKRRLLDFAVSNSTWRAGTLTIIYRQPFDLIAEAATRSAAIVVEEGVESAKSEIWLGY